jgi:hypothetical protein
MIQEKLTALELSQDLLKRGHRCNKGLAHSWVDWPAAYQFHWGGSKCSTLGGTAMLYTGLDYHRSC